MKITDQETKEHILKRLRRIEGQVRGVQGMLEEERDCHEIMQQLAAIHSAIQGASRLFFQEYANTCLAGMGGPVGADSHNSQPVKQEKLIQEMLILLDKVP
jgi:DNA-binding FrmR family transcriptional regulator